MVNTNSKNDRIRKLATIGFADLIHSSAGQYSP